MKKKSCDNRKTNKTSNLDKKNSKVEIINVENELTHDDLDIIPKEELINQSNTVDERNFDFFIFEKFNFSAINWKDSDIITLDSLKVQSEKGKSSENDDSKTSTSSANSVYGEDEDSRIIVDEEEEEMYKDFLSKKRNRNINN